MEILPSRRLQLDRLLDRLPLHDRTLMNWALLDQALVHPTFSPTANNDHLEFCGDSVIRLEVTLYLHTFYPFSLGDLTNLRNQLVSDRVLADIADGYHLDQFLLVSPEASHHTPRSRLADAFEALTGALYLSTGDFRLISPWLDGHWERLIPSLKQQPAFGNYKVALQELTQAAWKELPEYRMIATRPQFVTEVWIQNQCWGKGEGNSIKAAHQKAAAEALPALEAFLSNPVAPNHENLS